MYQLSYFQKLERKLSPQKVSIQAPNTNVDWVVYHVPKTAGSSLRQSFVDALGQRKVFGVYRNTGAAELGSGNPIWVPRSAKVVFGHFPTHEAQMEMFPSARKVTWVRDPLERAWSLLGHYLATEDQNAQYAFVKKHYLDKGITKKADIFERMIKDNALSKNIFVYAHYFESIPLNKFDFVGSTLRNSKDLKRLQELLGKSLVEAKENVRNSMSSFPSELRYLESYFASEYNIVADYL
jgi:hypothetical protein